MPAVAAGHGRGRRRSSGRAASASSPVAMGVADDPQACAAPPSPPKSSSMLPSSPMRHARAGGLRRRVERAACAQVVANRDLHLAAEHEALQLRREFGRIGILQQQPDGFVVDASAARTTRSRGLSASASRSIASGRPAMRATSFMNCACAKATASRPCQGDDVVVGQGEHGRFQECSACPEGGRELDCTGCETPE